MMQLRYQHFKLSLKFHSCQFVAHVDYQEEVKSRLKCAHIYYNFSRVCPIIKAYQDRVRNCGKVYIAMNKNTHS